MKQGRTDGDWAVVAVMAFGAGVVITWALSSPHPAWPELTVEQWAAWVQAIGSVFAILLAIAVPATQHFLAIRKIQQEDKDRARSLGLLLLPAIRSLAESNSNIWAHEDPDGGVEDFESNSCIAGPWTLAALEIPEILSARIDQFHILGAAASGLQRAVFNVLAAADLLVEMDFEIKGDYGMNLERTEMLIHNKSKFYDLMWDALLGLGESERKIEGMFDHQPRPTAKR